MPEALIALGFLVLAAIIGAVLKPNEDQLRPLTPQVSGAGHADAHGGQHH